MITKRRRGGKVQVTFVIDLDAPPEPVYVVGAFNDWDESATPLKESKDGTRRATITLPEGSRVPFRYITGSGEWFDDDAADEFEPNEHGSRNGVIRV